MLAAVTVRAAPGGVATVRAADAARGLHVGRHRRDRLVRLARLPAQVEQPGPDLAIAAVAADVAAANGGAGANGDASANGDAGAKGDGAADGASAEVDVAAMLRAALRKLSRA